MYQFQCLYCSSHEVEFEKWINSRQKVTVHPDGRIEKGPQRLDANNSLGAQYGYVCKKCGRSVHLGPDEIQTEEELKDYLTMDPEVIRAENESYLDQIREAAWEEELDFEPDERVEEVSDSGC